MAFPNLFPTGKTMLLQPCIHEFDMHEYPLQLIHYHDNRFGQHPRFRYYINNLIMCHQSNATASIFVKINLEDTLPLTIIELVNQLQDMVNQKIGERVARFGSSLCGTCSYWNKSRVELTNMINQQGTPMFFFTLSATDTKWPDLDALMPVGRPTGLAQDYQWKIHNITSNPHITSQYMHNNLKTFLQEVLQKGFHITDSWCRYYTIYSFFFLFVFFTLYNLFLIYAFSSHVDMNGIIKDPHTFMVLFCWKMHQLWIR